MPKVDDELGKLIPSDKIIKFNHIKQMFEKEETSIIKVAHALKESALHPTNIQKVSPKLALCKLNVASLYSLYFSSNIVHCILSIYLIISPYF